MALTLASEPPDVVIARLVAAQLAACAGLIAFFGTQISSMENEEVNQPNQVPALQVVTMAQAPKRRSTGLVDSVITLEVRAVMPRPTPPSSWIVMPAAPIVTNPGPGITYRITQFGAAGESWASEAAISTGLATLTLPALASGCTGFRIWRSEAARTWCRWVGTARTAGTWIDSAAYAMGAECAPIRGLGSRLLAMASECLMDRDTDGQYLPSVGRYMAAGGLTLKPLPTRYYRDRNLVAHILEAAYLTTYDPEKQVIS